MPTAGPSGIEKLTDSSLEAVRAWLAGRAASADTPLALTLLLRRYAATGRDDLREAVGAGLAQGMVEADRTAERDERSAWLALLLEASELADDDRLTETAGRLVTALSSEWPGSGTVASIMGAVEAVLAAGARSDDLPGLNQVAAAVDEMERVIGRSYGPGSGVAHEIGTVRSDRGTLADHAGAASALLTAYRMTGRIPYGMLADELMQFARRQWWDARAGWPPAPFDVACQATRVLCRLAALHEDADYRQGAIVAGADYRTDAARALSSLEPAITAAAGTAIYALAVTELNALG